MFVLWKKIIQISVCLSVKIAYFCQSFRFSSIRFSLSHPTDQSDMLAKRCPTVNVAKYYCTMGARAHRLTNQVKSKIKRAHFLIRNKINETHK